MHRLEVEMDGNHLENIKLSTLAEGRIELQGQRQVGSDTGES